MSQLKYTKDKIDKLIPLLLGHFFKYFNNGECRDFYGAEFLIASNLIEDKSESYNILEKKILGKYHKRKSDKTYHYEFIRFALEGTKIGRELNFNSWDFRWGNRTINWMLLRQTTLAKSPSLLSFFNLFIVILKLIINKDRNTICDEPGKISTQYNNFILFLIQYLFRESKSVGVRLLFKLTRKYFLRTESIYKEIGHINFFGRGKYQIFGYGAYLSYLMLRQYNDDVSSERYLQLNFILEILEKAIVDPNFDLVISSFERHRRIDNKTFYYTYNNNTDYIAFLIWHLSFVKKLLDEIH